MKLTKKFVIVLSIICAALLFTQCDLLAWIDPFNTQFSDISEAVRYEAAAKSNIPTSPTTLTVMTWNIKYAGGEFTFFWEKDGTKYNMSAGEVNYALDGIIEYINSINPDILLIQEIDIEATRSAYIDMCQRLIEGTEMNYGAYASIWHSDFVPQAGLQRMDMGNMTLSRYPITEATRINLPSPTDHDAVTEYFYMQRNLLRTKIDIPDFTTDFYVLNIHTEPFSTESKNPKEGHTKWKHINVLYEEMTKLQNEGAVVLAGGDLNAIPNYSAATFGFEGLADYAADAAKTYEGEETWLDPLIINAAFNNAVVNIENFNLPAFDEEAEQKLYYTFPATYKSEDPEPPGGYWNRTLDYLFSNSTFTAGGYVDQTIASYTVLERILSDHAPIIAILEGF